MSERRKPTKRTVAQVSARIKEQCLQRIKDSRLEAIAARRRGGDLSASASHSPSSHAAATSSADEIGSGVWHMLRGSFFALVPRARGCVVLAGMGKRSPVAKVLFEEP